MAWQFTDSVYDGHPCAKATIHEFGNTYELMECPYGSTQYVLRVTKGVDVTTVHINYGVVDTLKTRIREIRGE
jgi:hypothetical protein